MEKQINDLTQLKKKNEKIWVYMQQCLHLAVGMDNKLFKL